jgi:glycosyltransferase involved in cell wall biosynthesis
MKGKRTILQVFASKSWGGGEQYVYDLSKKLIKNGNEIFFLSKKSLIIKEKISALDKLLFFTYLKGIIDLYSPFKLYNIVKKYNVDIVHIHRFHDAFTTMLTKILFKRKLKIVITRHLVKKAKTNFFYGLVYRSIDKIIFVSELAKNVFLSTNPRINIDKIEVVHNSVLPDEFTNDVICNYRAKFSINETNFIFLYVGRLDKEKGLEILLTALPKLTNQNYTLLIAGTGKKEYEKQLKQLVLSLNIENKVVFIGFVDDVTDLIKQIDIGIMPSIGQEAFGLAALEFMCGGKPIITTDNGAQKEFIQNNINGILIPPNNVFALADELNKLMENEQCIKLIGLNAKKHFEDKLNYDVFFDKINRIYNSI